MLQEELARTRELPVPPQPRRSGILARSDDNLAGDTRDTRDTREQSLQIM